MKDTLVILNPAARSERAGHWRSRVEKVAHGAALRSTSRIGEAESLARKAAREGYQRIVAAGGQRLCHRTRFAFGRLEAMLADYL
ncbi:MAG: hypothetical protein DME46_12330 [Verrucomicrobia bacterium]|nr:MAG: hypothetical protein DME46_12330 [Verrucomicrobiota bacterium]